MGRTREQQEEAAVANYVDIDESTIETYGGGASEVTNSTINDVLGDVNDDDEYDDMAYF